LHNNKFFGPGYRQLYSVLLVLIYAYNSTSIKLSVDTCIIILRKKPKTKVELKHT